MTLECPLITTHHHRLLVTDEVSQQLSITHPTTALLILPADLTVVLLEHTSHSFLFGFMFASVCGHVPATFQACKVIGTKSPN